jgi:hypothetical protein
MFDDFCFKKCNSSSRNDSTCLRKQETLSMARVKPSRQKQIKDPDVLLQLCLQGLVADKAHSSMSEKQQRTVPQNVKPSCIKTIPTVKQATEKEILFPFNSAQTQ